MKTIRFQLLLLALFVMVGCQKDEMSTAPETRDIDWAVARVAQLEAEGISQKDAIKQAAKEADLSKRDVYNFIVQNK